MKRIRNTKAMEREGKSKEINFKPPQNNETFLNILYGKHNNNLWIVSEQYVIGRYLLNTVDTAISLFFSKRCILIYEFKNRSWKHKPHLKMYPPSVDFHLKQTTNGAARPKKLKITTSYDQLE